MFGFLRKKKKDPTDEELASTKLLELKNSPVFAQLQETAENFSTDFDISSQSENELIPPIFDTNAPLQTNISKSSNSHEDYLIDDDYQNSLPNIPTKKIPVLNISHLDPEFKAILAAQNIKTQLAGNIAPKTVLKTTIQSSTVSKIDSLTFLDNLLAALTGFKIENIPPENRETVLTQALKIYTDYIITFVEQKYGKKEASRLQIIQKYGDNSLFKKYVELGEIFQDAYQNFVLTLKNSNK